MSFKFFDNLKVTHTAGHILEETHYYPFGLAMAGISTKALNNVAPNNYKFNAGNELNENFGINLYETFYRLQDVQTGRFLNTDPLAEKYYSITTYNYAGNNPINSNDPLGDQMKDYGRMQKGPDGNYHSGWVSEMMWENKNSFNFGYSWGNSGGGSGGIVFNLFYGTAKDKDQRYSLKSATDKNGIEGIRISWWEEGSSDAEKLQELVGHSVFLSNSSNTGAQGGGGMTFPSFSTLWGNYPQDVNGSHAHPSVDPYPNQCAIRVSDAFQKSGIDMSSYPKVNKTSDGYARSSKGLADWTWQNFGKPKIMSVETFQKNYSGQTGLIFENANPGYTSHIDLWNAGATGSGFYTVSYKEIWFWPIK